jgi:hypothetical protein
MVANPRAVANFAKAMMSRSKTEQIRGQFSKSYGLGGCLNLWSRPKAHLTRGK